MARGRPVSRAKRNIKWIEDYCVIPEGPDVGKPVKLRKWQKAEITKIYNNKHGTRRAIISFGRKNAKSTLAAFLLLLHLCGKEAKRNSQLYSSAQSREQAGLIFKLAAKIIRMSPVLRAVIVVKDTRKELECKELGTVYQALSADASTAFGINPVFMVHDELGQVRGPTSELYGALETATGAQAQPLSVIISTQAATDNDLLSKLIDDALAAHDPRVTVSLYTAPPTDDPFDEKTIRKANPAFGDFLNKAEVMAMAEDARRMPSRESEFRNLVLNQRVEINNPFIAKETWDACGAKPTLFWANTPVYGGLDLSSCNDLTALVLIANINERWHVKPTFWLPEDGLKERSRIEHIPYDVWKNEGFLETTPGRAIEYEWVAHKLYEMLPSLNVKKIAFDRWNFRNFRPWLVKAGFSETYIDEKFVEFGQGTRSMSPAILATETAILQKKICHGNHPVLAMCVASTVIHEDTQKNRVLDKKKSRKRIDGMVCLTMAIGEATGTREEKPKEYQIMII